MNNENKRTEIAQSDDFYNLTNFIIVTFVLGMALASPFLISDTISKLVIILSSICAFLIAFAIASYFYLNKMKFYQDRIEIKYLIRHNYEKKKSIMLTNVVSLKYKYTGGRGSGGLGQLKVYFTCGNKNKQIQCSMNKASAASVCSLMKAKKIPVEIYPSWVLSEYGV